MNLWKIGSVALTVFVAVVIGFGIFQYETASAEPQPHMGAAHELLKEARGLLERAEPNKGGHRERAIELVDQAIRQTDEGIKWANSH